jgi:DNA-damage-inducible protein D
MAVRQELTDEWKKRDVTPGKDFAILTDEISKATFGKTVEEYKDFKKLKKENLRDHMNDLELIFNMLGKRVTTEITRVKEARGLNKCKDAAKDGGEVAGNARKEAEKKIGKPITTTDNYLYAPEKDKRKRIK